MATDLSLPSGPFDLEDILPSGSETDTDSGTFGGVDLDTSEFDDGDFFSVEFATVTGNLDARDLEDLFPGGNGGGGFFGSSANLFVEINGNASANNIQGSGGVDVINGRGGNDIIRGNDGDDYIFGASGADSLNGNDGDDIISGGGGRDILAGGNGEDQLSGDGGADILAGRDGDDQIDGGNGRDIITGGADDDTIDGGAGNDTIYGDNVSNNVADTQFESNGVSSININRLAASDGDQTGDDCIYGGDGNDTIFGGGGLDTINGGDGNDDLRGQGGADVFEFTTDSSDDNFGDDQIFGFRDSGGAGDQIDLTGVAGLREIIVTNDGNTIELELFNRNGDDLGTIEVNGASAARVNGLDREASYGTGTNELVRVDSGVTVFLDEGTTGNNSFVTS